MNLETQIRQIRGRLADPRRTDETDPFIRDTEIIDWIHHGEVQVLRDVPERELFIEIATFAAVIGQERYDKATANFPQDVVDPVFVRYAGVECVRHAVHELGSLQYGDALRPRKGLNQYFYLLAGGLGTATLGIRPVPDDTSQIELWYVRRPYKRFKHAYVQLSAAGTPTTLISSSLTHVNDYWNGCEVRVAEGSIYQGEERVVSDFDATTDTLTVATAMPEAIGTGPFIELGEVSELPPDLEPLVNAWAVYLGFLKMMAPMSAQLARTEYRELHAAHMQRYGYGRVEPSREQESRVQ